MFFAGCEDGNLDDCRDNVLGGMIYQRTVLVSVNGWEANQVILRDPWQWKIPSGQFHVKHDLQVCPVARPSDKQEHLQHMDSPGAQGCRVTISDRRFHNYLTMARRRCRVALYRQRERMAMAKG